MSGDDGLTLEGADFGYDEEGSSAHRVEIQVGKTPVSCTIYEPGYQWGLTPREAALEEQQPVFLPPPLLEPVEAGQEQVDQRTKDRERRPPRRVWRVVPAVPTPTAPAWVVGSLVHEALASWRFPHDGFEDWVSARARQYGIADPEQLGDAARRTRRLLSHFQAHSLYAEMDSAECRQHELPYSRIVEGRVENGIIDALYRRDGSWTIVEFKTDKVSDQEELDRLLDKEDYLAQAHRYVAAVEDLLGQEPRSILCMLNYAGGVRLLDPLEEGVGSGSGMT